MATTTRLIRPLLRPPPHPLSRTTTSTPQKIRSFHALLRPPTGTTPTPHRPHSHLRPSHPPLLPRSPLTTTQTRHFSDLPTALSSALSLTQSLITTLHTTTHTPWYLTIPLLALTLHLAARLPLAIYTRRILVRRARLVPLLQAWRARHTMALAATPKRKDEVAKRLALTTKRVYHKWGVERWKDSVGLAAMPVWLVGIEALRRMCGGPKGLIGTVVFGAGAGAEGEGGAAVGEGLAEGLSTGGCLWFPDLTVADPLHLLPFALSVVLVANVMPRTQVGARRMFGLDDGGMTVPMGKTSDRLRRGLVVMALAIGPVTMDLPAALHLYWLSSATLSLLQTELAAYFMPLPGSMPRPCTEMELRFIRPRQKKTQEKME